MNTLAINKKWDKPNYLTILFLLIFIRLITFNYSFSVIFEYAIWLLNMSYFILRYYKNSYCSKVFYLFIILALVQIIGVFFNPTLYSMKNVISTLFVAFLVESVFNVQVIQYKYIKYMYYITSLSLVTLAHNTDAAMNTIPGCMVFISLTMIIFERMYYTKSKRNISRCKYQSKRNILRCKYLKKFLFLSIPIIDTLAYIIIPVYIAMALHSRTALFMIPIFMIVYLFFCFMSKRKRRLWIYDLLCVALLLVIIFYINIESFWWYPQINAISNKYFNKNVNSSRPLIWLNGIEGMDFLQVIIGRGTGTLPTLENYIGNSFHSSYIQLFVQNGIIGIVVLFLILRYFWRYISYRIKNPNLKLFSSFFVCIMIYNLFECTLLQNKTFLGNIQWVTISLGVVYAKNFIKNPCICVKEFGIDIKNNMGVAYGIR